MPFKNRGLYAITQQTADTPALLAWAQAVIDGGAVWLQYRDKSTNAALRQQQAAALARLCRTQGARFIVNDDAALAEACAADGVHLGADDGDVAAARARLGPQYWIGASCYDDDHRAVVMAHAGADYLAFGAFHPSGTKPLAKMASPALLMRARALGKPLVAIGGITPENGSMLLQAGADLLAVVGGLVGPPEAARNAARRYAALF